MHCNSLPLFIIKKLLIFLSIHSFKISNSITLLFHNDWTQNAKREKTPNELISNNKKVSRRGKKQQTKQKSFVIISFSCVCVPGIYMLDWMKTWRSRILKSKKIKILKFIINYCYCGTFISDFSLSLSHSPLLSILPYLSNHCLLIKIEESNEKDETETEYRLRIQNWNGYWIEKENLAFKTANLLRIFVVIFSFFWYPQMILFLLLFWFIIVFI